EPVTPTTVTAASVLVTDALGAAQAGAVLLTAGGTLVTFVAAAPWTSGASYTVTLRASIVDLSGNALDGDADGAAGGDFVLAFRIVAAPDTVPPRVAYAIPGDGFTGVDLGAAVTVVFTEMIDGATLD